jgi:hypothetical protein
VCVIDGDRLVAVAGITPVMALGVDVNSSNK